MKPARPEKLTHGTIIDRRAGRPVRGRDRRDNPVFEAEWAEQRLVKARLRLPDGRWLTLEAGAGQHPMFGRCDTVTLGEGQPLARFQAVDWTNPAHIPPLDWPGALPSGAGTAILNLLAQQAQRRGRAALRYRGPYPTGALFDALADCFRPQGDVSTAFHRFTEQVELAAATGEMVEPPVDFEPAPFERVWFEAGVCVQLRSGVEKVYIDGRAYARATVGARRLKQTESGTTALVEIGGEPWAEVLRLDERGDLIEGPTPLPPVDSPALGRPLADSVRAALVDALPPRAPALMQPALRQVLTATPIAWGDPGDDVAAIRGDTIVLHAVLLERLARRPPDEILTAIALVIEPWAHLLAQRMLAEAEEQGSKVAR
jgi:hypothetical protein